MRVEELKAIVSKYYATTPQTQRKYASCHFDGSIKQYSYVCIPDDLKEGDAVLVEARNGFSEAIFERYIESRPSLPENVVFKCIVCKE